MSCDPNRAFERVYTMTDYYDGPRGGIADFNGRPHVYESRFEDIRGDDADIYELRAVDARTLALALEDWNIWLRWEDAYYAGGTTTADHPALPADRVRHDEIQKELAARLAALPGPVVRATAAFQPRAGYADGGRGRSLEVQWTPIV
jgi:hypothetical protein